MRNSVVIACIGVVGAFTASSACAANLLTNGGFEIDGPAANDATNPGIGSTAITGWKVVNNSGTTVDDGNDVLWIGNGGYDLYTPFGTDFLDLTGTVDHFPYPGVTQSVSTILGQAYTLSFYLGVSDNFGGGPVSATVRVGPTAESPIMSMTFVDPGTSGISINGSLWTLQTFDFVATSTTTAVTFVGAEGGDFIGLDDVDLEVSAVPEANTWAMAVVGFGAIGGAMRNRARKALPTPG